MKKIKLAPDIECKKKFGTAGKEVTTALGAYSALPLRIGSMQMSAPAILLDSNGYDILLRTFFLVQYLATANFGQGTFTIMGHTVPMYNKIGADLSKGQTTNIYMTMV